ncbi:MAG: hypothetical protein CMI54_02575 [Parcubacteria group bacterium]|nr:hypothetical protein [Parcubacteria group bacterium]|tara:strand:+ start:23 stop:274 length:252 start_codon:yes stop_codon:yes gene_type:complete
MNNQEAASFLKTLIYKSGKKQIMIAEELGIHRQRVNDAITADKPFPFLKVKIMLANYFGYDLQVLKKVDIKFIKKDSEIHNGV